MLQLSIFKIRFYHIGFPEINWEIKIRLCQILLEGASVITSIEEAKRKIEDASLRANKLEKPQFVSIVKQIAQFDPLSVYYNGRHLYEGKRFFWKDAYDPFYLVGFDYAHIIEKNKGRDRFKYVEEEWKRFIKSVEDNKTPFGTGNLLFGGFSFHPYQKEDNLWTSFPVSRFFVPKVLFTSYNKEAFLTFNRYIKQGESVEDIIKEMEHIEETFLASDTLPSQVHNRDAVQHEVAPEEWKRAVKHATEQIRSGEIEKVVLARELQVTFHEKIWSEYALSSLLEEQNLSYIFAVEQDSQCFIGASPERLVKSVDGEVFSTCLAGSIPRGHSAEEDEKLGEELLNDEKNLFEHNLVVNMIEKAMKETCLNVYAPEHPTLYKVKHIQHLYTPIRGKAKEGTTLIELVEKLHPTPALGGYPKEESIEVLEKLEVFERGWYAAPIGWLDGDGNGEFIVGIRSALLRGHEASLFAGCGIVADSDPQSEYEETKTKFKPMLSALGGMNNDK